MPTLYSWHTPGFDITCDRLVRTESSYCISVAKYEEKIERLSKHLGTDQYIFCFVRPRLFEHDRVPWIIEARDEDVLAYIDNGRWEDYLRDACSLYFTLRSRFTGVEDWSAIHKLPVASDRCRRLSRESYANLLE